MSQPRLPPPEPEDCLIHRRASRYRGGTLIAEDVHDLATHRRRLADPDGYRPACCPRCGWDVLHRHDYPCRTLRGGRDPPEVRVVRHICAAPECRATWRTLPAFLARHLWRSWPTVERAVQQDTSERESAPIPERTVQRWRARLASGAKQLVVLLATSGGAALESIAKAVGLLATRRELVVAYAAESEAAEVYPLGRVAGIVHRLARGLRLM